MRDFGHLSRRTTRAMGGDLLVLALLSVEALLPSLVFGLRLDAVVIVALVAGVAAGYLLLRAAHQIVATRLAHRLGRWSSPAVASVLVAVVAAGGVWRGLPHWSIPIASVGAAALPWIFAAVLGPAPRARGRAVLCGLGCLLLYAAVVILVDLNTLVFLPRYATTTWALLSSALIASTLVVLPPLRRPAVRPVFAGAALVAAATLFSGSAGARAAGYLRRQAEIASLVHPVGWLNALAHPRLLTSGTTPCRPPVNRTPIVFTGEPRPFNVLLLTIDTVRSDFFAGPEPFERLYPNLASLMRQGCGYSQVRSVAASTHIAMPALYNGTMSWLRLERPVLGALARHAGLRGRAFGGLAAIEAYSGLPLGNAPSEPTAVTSRLLAEIDRAHRDGTRWLLAGHYMRVHLPRKARLFAHPTTDARPFYAGKLAEIDRELGEVFARLKQLGLWESTIIVITSDHGEELNERGYSEHAFHLYETVLRVPLIARVPGGRCLAADTPLSTLDVAPMIVDGLGLQITSPPDIGAWPPAPRSAHYAFSGEGGPFMAIVKGARKTVLDARYGDIESYDLNADPQERRDLGAPPGVSLGALLRELPLPVNPVMPMHTHLRGLGPDPAAECPPWAARR